MSEVPDAAALVTPTEAAAVFGAQLELAERFVALLAQEGVRRGLIGPREVVRLWDRHVLNCAVVADLVDEGLTVVDVGSGAGLPGLPIAIARPDLQLVLVEPMLRRVTWLNEAVAQLGLTNVTVVRGRAESQWGELTAPVVTARAVAPLDRLSAWCLPLVAGDGQLLAMKGERGAAELAETELPAGVTGSVVTCGGAVLSDPTTVVTLHVAQAVAAVPAVQGVRRTGGGSAPRKVTRPGRKQTKRGR